MYNYKKYNIIRKLKFLRLLNLLSFKYLYVLFLY